VTQKSAAVMGGNRIAGMSLRCNAKSVRGSNVKPPRCSERPVAEHVIRRKHYHRHHHRRHRDGFHWRT
jgi:hypothetical protein